MIMPAEEPRGNKTNKDDREDRSKTHTPKHTPILSYLTNKNITQVEEP